jgi:hypothetical protein
MFSVAYVPGVLNHWRRKKPAFLDGFAGEWVFGREILWTGEKFRFQPAQGRFVRFFSGIQWSSCAG